MRTLPPEHAQTRSGRGDPVHEALRAAICVPIKRYLWTPADEIEFVPALSDTICGDGRALFKLYTINQRPAHYMIRVDSGWATDSEHRWPYDAPNIADFVDDICQALEEEFGCRRADNEEEDEELRENGYPWPAFDHEGGCSWARMEWPKLAGIATVPHPFTWKGNLLAAPPGDVARGAALDENGRWMDDGGSEFIHYWLRD